MLFFNRHRPTNKVILDKPLDLSTEPTSLSQGRSLFAEPSESEELGLIDIDEGPSGGIRVPSLRPSDTSTNGLGDSSALTQL